MSHMTGLEVSPFIKHQVNDIWLLIIAECSREECEKDRENSYLHQRSGITSDLV